MHTYMSLPTMKNICIRYILLTYPSTAQNSANIFPVRSRHKTCTHVQLLFAIILCSTPKLARHLFKLWVWVIFTIPSSIPAVFHSFLARAFSHVIKRESILDFDVASGWNVCPSFIQKYLCYYLELPFSSTLNEDRNCALMYEINMKVHGAIRYVIIPNNSKRNSKKFCYADWMLCKYD